MSPKTRAALELAALWLSILTWVGVVAYCIEGVWGLKEDVAQVELRMKTIEFRLDALRGMQVSK